MEIARGETLGLVGESGSGKTTLARVLLGLIPADPGSVVELDGQQLAAQTARRTREQLKALQIVFQNPDSALNRRHTVRRLVSRPLVKLAGLSGQRLADRLFDLIRSVRLEERHLSLRPSQLSGGLKQRVAIARAFGGGPRLLVCDEPTSALDVSVQAAILNLLADLQAKEQVTYLFISPIPARGREENHHQQHSRLHRLRPRCVDRFESDSNRPGNSQWGKRGRQGECGC